ncbi:PTS system, glucose subfamily, IIA subunit [Paenibacillus vortex V453]|uniref:PTS system, glucose subfamily, IIA subunit n=1 Tax=Paenibacillus vortex V453 TaxID=715225 RepID=A0A2R9SRJ6_9BACL|nr:PTS system, glucose subfamily, IIA subunit [Paenibacillus vortex V453]
MKSGQTLIEFDMAAIKAAGYPTITPIIVTNADEVASKVEGQIGDVVSGQDHVLTIELK